MGVVSSVKLRQGEIPVKKLRAIGLIPVVKMIEKGTGLHCKAVRQMGLAFFEAKREIGLVPVVMLTERRELPLW